MTKRMLDYAGPDTHSSERGGIGRGCRMVLYPALSLAGVAAAYWAAAANEPVGHRLRRVHRTDGRTMDCCCASWRVTVPPHIFRAFSGASH